MQNRGRLPREQKLKIINFPNGRGEVIPPSLIVLALSRAGAFPAVDAAFVFTYVERLEYREQVRTAGIKIQRVKAEKKREVRARGTGELRRKQ